MKRNAIRIVCNPYNNQISYYFLLVGRREECLNSLREPGHSRFIKS